uniref:Uncharacterized protein n=1 Tax=Cannabis sativa TaxID=3483 RepID=A0A803R6J8_CANSA
MSNLSRFRYLNFMVQSGVLPRVVISTHYHLGSTIYQLGRALSLYTFTLLLQQMLQCQATHCLNLVFFGDLIWLKNLGEERSEETV